MTPEEKNALINFFGVMHAEARQTDSNIVGSSKDVRPISDTFRNTLQAALTPPQQIPPPVHGGGIVPPGHMLSPTIPAMQPPHNAVVQPPIAQATQVPIASNTHSGIEEQLKQINLTLTKLVSIIEKKNGPKKTRTTKQV
jgi:hypothetical protein